MASMAFLPLDRALIPQSLAVQVISAPPLLSTVLQIQSFLGHMAASIIVVSYARCHMHPLQMWFLHSFRLGVDDQLKCLSPPLHARDSLRWWTHMQTLTRGMPFLPPPLQMTLTTDASL